MPGSQRTLCTPGSQCVQCTPAASGRQELPAQRWEAADAVVPRARRPGEREQRRRQHRQTTRAGHWEEVVGAERPPPNAQHASSAGVGAERPLVGALSYLGSSENGRAAIGAIPAQVGAVQSVQQKHSRLDLSISGKVILVIAVIAVWRSEVTLAVTWRAVHRQLPA